MLLRPPLQIHISKSSPTAVKMTQALSTLSSSVTEAEMISSPAAQLSLVSSFVPHRPSWPTLCFALPYLVPPTVSQLPLWVLPTPPCSNVLSLAGATPSHSHRFQMVASLCGSNSPWVLLTPFSPCPFSPMVTVATHCFYSFFLSSGLTLWFAVVNRMW